MSRQLYMYALPTDVQRTIEELSEKLGARMISPTSPGPEPNWIDSPIRNGSLLSPQHSMSVHCYLVPNGSANLRFQYYPKLSAWHVTSDSELIEVSGCDFDGKILSRGRFYCQLDKLAGREIINKSTEFVNWADKVFRLARKYLHRSRELDAYVGPEAEAWEKQGGRFASLVLGHKIIFASGNTSENDRGQALTP